MFIGKRLVMKVTSILFALPSLFLTTTLALLYLGFIPRKWVRLLSVAAVAVPFLITAVLLIEGAGHKMVEFRLEGLKFSLHEKDGSPRWISFGGCSSSDEELCLKQDDVFVPGYPPGAFLVGMDRDTLVLKPGRGFDTRSVVQVNSLFPGLRDLVSGDKITLQGEVGDALLFNQKGLFGSEVSLVSGRESRQIENRQSQIPFLDWPVSLQTFPSWKARVYPLSNFLPGGRVGVSLNGLHACILFGRGCRTNSREVNQAGILPLASTIQVNSKSLQAYPARIAEGGALTFFQLQGTPQHAFLKPVLSIREVAFGNGCAILRLAVPRIVSVGEVRDGEQFVLSSGRGLRGEDKLIRFEDLSDRFADVLARITVGANSFQVVSPQGSTEIDNGRIVELGTVDRLLVRLNRNGIPMTLLRVLAATLIGTILLGSRLLCRYRYVAIFGFTAILTNTRLLFAHAATVLPPFSQEAVPLAIYLLPTAPALVIATNALVRSLELREIEPLQRRIFISSEGIVALLFAGMVGLPHVLGLSILLRLGTVVPLLVLALALAGSLVAPAGPVRAHRDAAFRWMSGPDYNALWWFALLVYGTRLVAFLFGVKEQIPLGGGRVPVSLIMVPLYVCLLAAGCSAYFKQSAMPGRFVDAVKQFGRYVVGVTGLHILLGLLSSDLGMLIYVIPVSVFLSCLGVQCMRALHRRERGYGLLLFVPMAVIVLSLLYPLAALRVGAMYVDKEEIVDQLQDPDALVTEQNLLRLLQYLEPEHLREIGTRSSEAIAQYIAIMDRYVHYGWTGLGFLNVSPVRALYQTCTSDNVGAVYVMAQFGVVGAAGLLLAYCALLAAGMRSGDEIVEQGVQAWRFASSLSLLSALVLIIVSGYMLGANCNLLPFTGRNMYFLGLESLGDVYESLILLCLVVAGAAIGEKLK